MNLKFLLFHPYKKEVMKNILLLSLITILMLSSCSKEDPVIDLTGEWTGTGYECPATVFHDEIVNVEHDLTTGLFVGTLITGNPCMNEGAKSFEGFYDGSEKSIRVIAVAGSAEAPSSSEVGGRATIENANLFTVTALGTTVEFSRN